MSETLQNITWSGFIFLILFESHILCCLKCDNTARGVMKTFDSIVKNGNEDDAGASLKLKEFVDIAAKNLMEEIERMFLDHYAIYQIGSEYKKCVDLIEEGNFKGAQLINAIGIHFQQLKLKFKDILAKFQKRVCPNKKGEMNCGIMVQKFIACHKCDEEKLVCVGGPSSVAEWFVNCGCYCTSEKTCQDLKTGQRCTPCENSDHYFKSALFCGERSVKVVEDGDLILDCSLTWHAKLEDQYQYVFYKKSDLVTMRITEEPFLVKKDVQMNDSDVYICRTQLHSLIPVSIITYNVTVVKMPGPKHYHLRPTLPYVAPVTPHTVADVNIEETINTHAQITTYVCGSFIIIFISAMSIYMFYKRKILIKRASEKLKQYKEDMLLLSN